MTFARFIISIRPRASSMLRQPLPGNRTTTRIYIQTIFTRNYHCVMMQELIIAMNRNYRRSRPMMSCAKYALSAKEKFVFCRVVMCPRAGSVLTNVKFVVFVERKLKINSKYIYNEDHIKSSNDDKLYTIINVNANRFGRTLRRTNRKAH